MVELPEELLRLIFQLFRHPIPPRNRRDMEWKTPEPPSTLPTLLNISLASKALNRIVRPTLFYALDVRSRYGWAETRPLLQTLLVAHPGTAKCVTELPVDLWCTQDDIDDMTTRKEWLVEPPPVELADQLRLLDICPPENIQKTLVAAVVWESVLWPEETCGRSFSDTTAAFRPLQMLANVSVDNWDSIIKAIDLTWFAALLQLPALKVLHDASGMFDRTGNASRLAFFRPSNVRSLYLDRSHGLDSRGLKRLFEACPLVEDLSVHWSGSIGVDYGALGNVLRHHGSRITDLESRCSSIYNTDTDAGGHAPLGQLGQLESLKILAGPHDALFGNDRGDRRDKSYLIKLLPKSLKVLTVGDAQDDDYMRTHDKQYLTLMQDQAFGELTTIRIERDEGFSCALPLAWSESWEYDHEEDFIGWCVWERSASQ